MAAVKEAYQIAYKLTSSDLELIKQLGLPNKIMASSLGISDAAISMKITRVAVKLGVENRTAMVIKALSLGLITVDQLVFREFNGEANLLGTTD